MVSKFNVYLKCFGSIRYPLNEYKTWTKINQGLNSCELVQTPKTALSLNSSKFVMVSKFNIYNVHLKCFDSIKYPLNQ